MRRKELLQLIVPKFEIIVSKVKETLVEGLTVEELALNRKYPFLNVQVVGNSVLGKSIYVVKLGHVK